MKLYYENVLGETIDLMNNPRFALISEVGLGSLAMNNLSQISTVLTEGSHVSYRTRSARSIILTHELVGDSREARREVSRILDQYAPGKIVYQDEGLHCYIPVEVETHEVILTNKPVTMTTTFLAPFPHFRDFETKEVVNKAAEGLWSMPFTFPVKFGKTNTDNTLMVVNDGDFDVGFVVQFTAVGGEVQHPALTNLNTREVINTTKSMGPNDTLTISTVQGNKYAEEYSSNTGDKFNVLDEIAEGSVLFSLRRGVNVLQPSATLGQQNMHCSIRFEQTYKTV